MEELGTEISTTGRDAAGNLLKGKAKQMEIRIAVDTIVDLFPKKAIISVNREITRLCQVLKINESVKQRGAAIFRECEKHKMMRGRTTTVFSAACLYAASREEGTSKTLTDFTNA